MNVTKSYELYLRRQIGWLKCDYCDRWFLFGSSGWHTHMLFIHEKYLEPCVTFQKKLTNTRVIMCWSLRPIAKKMKGRYKWSLRLKKTNLWRYGIKKFFFRIENEEQKLGDKIYSKY